MRLTMLSKVLGDDRWEAPNAHQVEEVATNSRVVPTGYPGRKECSAVASNPREEADKAYYSHGNTQATWGGHIFHGESKWP